MKKFLFIFLKILFYLTVFLACVYVLLWSFSFKTYPLKYGISFDIGYAEKLELDWQKAYITILDDLKPTYLRLSAPWDRIEEIRGTYDFTKVDYLLDQAVERGSKVTLVVGQKVPRWPECHLPTWSKQINIDEKKEALLSYVEETVRRYRNHPALEFWQVENEPFIKFEFGECLLFDSSAVRAEVEIIKKLDNKHPIIITDSGELSTWYEATHAGDIFGTTLYRTVRTPKGMIVTYDWLPAAYYKVRAWLWGKKSADFFISELQAEPWFGDDLPAETPILKMEKTLSPDRLLKNISYAKRLGASRAYLWGVEWWYWMKVVRNDSRYWEIGQDVLKN